MSTNAWIVFGFGLGALVFGGIGAGLVISNREFRRIAHRVPGQVVRLRPSRGDNGTVYYPTVRFMTANGQYVETETNIGSNPPLAPVGGQVAVLYDPAQPSRMRVDSFWGGGTGIGVLFAGTGGILLAVAMAVVAFGS